MVRVGLRQPLGNRQRRVEALQCLSQLALRHLNVADPVVRHRQIALPSRTGRVGPNQPLGNRPRRAEALQRLRQPALRDLHIADFAMRHQQTALPSRMARFGLR